MKNRKAQLEIGGAWVDFMAILLWLIIIFVFLVLFSLNGCTNDKTLPSEIKGVSEAVDADIELLNELEANKQILFRYSDEDGNVNDEYNPNGSQMNIAGIVNKNGNVMGMMPHPERACDPTLGRTDGQQIFKSIANYILN